MEINENFIIEVLNKHGFTEGDHEVYASTNTATFT